VWEIVLKLGGGSGGIGYEATALANFSLLN